MDLLIPVAVVAVLIAVLVAGVMWSRRGQSSIGRDSGGDTLEQVRRREKGMGSGGGWP
jgi:hypothetical protein